VALGTAVEEIDIRQHIKVGVLSHGPFTWKKFTRLPLQIALILGAGTVVTARPDGRSKE
jgi:hypothetical protein